MIDELLRQLQDPDPAERRSAIIALANTKNPAALKPLAQVYRSDPDPDLRELALKAGRYLHQQSQPVEAAESDYAAPAGTADNSAGSDAAQQPRQSTPRKRQSARNHLDAAIGFHTQGLTTRAIESLGKALTNDPDLIKDSLVSNLALTLVQRPLKDALPILTQPKLREAYIDSLGGKEKLIAQAHGKGAETATWGNVFADVFLYWLVSALATVVIIMFSLQMVEDMLGSSPTGDSSSFDADEIDVFSLEGMLVMIPSALLSSGYSVVALFIMGYAIHTAATRFLSGDGTLVFLYRKIVPLMTGWMLLTAGTFVALSLAGSWETVSAYFGSIMLVGSIIFVLLLASQVGDVYAFGITGGCGAMILGIIVLFVMMGCGMCALSWIG